MTRFSQLLLLLLCSSAVFGQHELDQRANLHFQATAIDQYAPSSNGSSSETQTTFTSTLYMGLRLWRGAEVYVNPEVATGSGLNSTMGIAATSNGETILTGYNNAGAYIARAYFRQTIGLGRQTEAHYSEANQLMGRSPKNYLRFTVGKFALRDMFDVNPYTNSSRTQFMNAGLINNSAWDYTANLRSYVTGGVAELKLNDVTCKVGVIADLNMNTVNALSADFIRSKGLNAEITKAFKITNKEGHIRVSGYYKESLAGSEVVPGQVADYYTNQTLANAVSVKKGAYVNLDQQIGYTTSVFARAGVNDNRNAAWVFPTPDQTFSAGFSANGGKWKRKNDHIGVAVVYNALGAQNKTTFETPSNIATNMKVAYGSEVASEIYYSFCPFNAGFFVTADYQYIQNPGYNANAAAAQVYSLRLHLSL